MDMDPFGILASGRKSRIKGGLNPIIKYPLWLIFRIIKIMNLILRGSGGLNNGKH